MPDFGPFAYQLKHNVASPSSCCMAFHIGVRHTYLADLRAESGKDSERTKLLRKHGHAAEHESHISVKLHVIMWPAKLNST